MHIEATEVTRLIDRLRTLAKCLSPAGYVSRDSSEPWAKRYLALVWGGANKIPADYPSPEQIRDECVEIGQKLAIAAAERGLASDAFDKLSISGWGFLKSVAQLPCQSLQTRALLEVTAPLVAAGLPVVGGEPIRGAELGNGKKTNAGRKKEKHVLAVEALINEGLDNDSINKRTGQSTANIRAIRSRMNAKS